MPCCSSTLAATREVVEEEVGLLMQENTVKSGRCSSCLNDLLISSLFSCVGVSTASKVPNEVVPARAGGAMSRVDVVDTIFCFLMVVVASSLSNCMSAVRFRLFRAMPSADGLAAVGSSLWMLMMSSEEGSIIIAVVVSADVGVDLVGDSFIFKSTTIIEVEIKRRDENGMARLGSIYLTWNGIQQCHRPTTTKNFLLTLSSRSFPLDQRHCCF